MDINQARCGRCSRMVTMNTKNSVLYVYAAQMWFAHWIVHCGNCNTYSRVYCRDSVQAEYTWAERNKIGVVRDMFAPDEVIAGFQGVYKVKTLEEHNLTDYQENQVRFLHWLLDHYDTRFFDDPEGGLV